MLAFAAEVTKKTNKWQSFSPVPTAPETLSDAFIAICGEQLDENGQNLIRVMAEKWSSEGAPGCS